mmetsp:Transcript_4204/g.5440  ORF Transcript_4204/g.5440 Transcript_4204/m.5440 type:complete len:330 (+) Transcript_4204:23-1012(+)
MRKKTSDGDWSEEILASEGDQFERGATFGGGSQEDCKMRVVLHNTSKARRGNDAASACDRQEGSKWCKMRIPAKEEDYKWSERRIVTKDCKWCEMHAVAKQNCYRQEGCRTCWRHVTTKQDFKDMQEFSEGEAIGPNMGSEREECMEMHERSHAGPKEERVQKACGKQSTKEQHHVELVSKGPDKQCDRHEHKRVHKKRVSEGEGKAERAKCTTKEQNKSENKQPTNAIDKMLVAIKQLEERKRDQRGINNLPAVPISHLNHPNTSTQIGPNSGSEGEECHAMEHRRSKVGPEQEESRDQRKHNGPSQLDKSARDTNKSNRGKKKHRSC